MPFAVYILASRPHGTLYIGVTRNLARRVGEHRTDQNAGFTAQYGVHRLVWYEFYDRIVEAIDREKALKKWRRDWKVELIEQMNPIGPISTRRSPAGPVPDVNPPPSFRGAAGETGIHAHRRLSS